MINTEPLLQPLPTRRGYHPLSSIFIHWNHPFQFQYHRSESKTFTGAFLFIEGWSHYIKKTIHASPLLSLLSGNKLPCTSTSSAIKRQSRTNIWGVNEYLLSTLIKLMIYQCTNKTYQKKKKKDKSRRSNSVSGRLIETGNSLLGILPGTIIIKEGRKCL